VVKKRSSSGEVFLFEGRIRIRIRIRIKIRVGFQELCV
jgi:hypothetical protein